MRFYAVIGVPASGKTTIVDEALGTYKDYHSTHLTNFKRNVSYALYDSGICRIFPYGIHRKTQQENIVDFIKDKEYSTIVCEGDQITDSKFFDAVMGVGYELVVVAVSTPPYLIKRRIDRKKYKSEAWLKQRTTIVGTLVRAYKKNVVLVPNVEKKDAVDLMRGTLIPLTKNNNGLE